MSFYRLKPQVVQAIQYHPGMKHKFVIQTDNDEIGVMTDNGFVKLSAGDWIIITGAARPSVCAADDFRGIYEPV